MSTIKNNHQDVRFADIQMLRYNLPGFNLLNTRQKLYIYYLAEATLYGRDITFDQFGKYNLRIRRLLESVYSYLSSSQPDDEQFHALRTYLYRIWFSNGIYHHYGSEKIMPGFTEQYLKTVVEHLPDEALPLLPGQSREQMLDELTTVMFSNDFLMKKVNKRKGEDLVATSAVNFYQNVSQSEAEKFYADMKDTADSTPPSYGLNSTLVKDEHGIHEVVWRVGGRYGEALTRICDNLNMARQFAENDRQRQIIDLLVDYYHTGSLKTFDDYSVAWTECHEGMVDFINGFIEVYNDPLALKASWEGIVHYVDKVATRRTQTISNNAQWFEDHSPVDPRFKKKKVVGVSAHAVCAAMLGGDEYPSTAIGINLPNSDWIRKMHGSKSVTIVNLTRAYDKAAQGSGFREEFVIDDDTRTLMAQYSDITDEVHTDLHECLGHGSGQLLDGTDPDALKEYGNTIEEARADLFGLYYMADEKLVSLGILPDSKAWQAQYYSYLMNGLMTQLTRISPGQQIEEAHMRNRALIAHWVMEHADGAVEIIQRDGKSFVAVNDYYALRPLFATLLSEVQRIKSEGDYQAARTLVEKYGVTVNSLLHEEVLSRFEQLDIAPYKGFINPKLSLVCDDNGMPVDVVASFDEPYEVQMMRYSSQYATLI